MLLLFLITFIIFRSEKRNRLAFVLFLSLFFDFWNQKPVGYTGMFVLLFFLVLWLFLWRLRGDSNRFKI